MKPRFSTTVMDQSFLVCIALDGCYFKEWKFISFFRGKNGNLEIFEYTSIKSGKDLW
jgi:hypothetical protein